MTIKPLADRVVIKAVAAEETTKSGIILTSSAQEKPAFAEVVAVGEGGTVDGKKVKMTVSVGQKVLISKYSGTEVKVDGEEYSIVKQEDILAIVEDAPAKKVSKKAETPETPNAETKSAEEEKAAPAKRGRKAAAKSTEAKTEEAPVKRGRKAAPKAETETPKSAPAPAKRGRKAAVKADEAKADDNKTVKTPAKRGRKPATKGKTPAKRGRKPAENK